MKKDGETYQTLLVSLPQLPPSFHQANKPLAKVLLEDRMEMLREEDIPFYKQVNTLITQEMECFNLNDDLVFKHLEALLQAAPSQEIKKLFEFLTNVMLIVASLRARQSDAPIPKHQGRLSAHIRRNWTHPSLNLEGRYPWIPSMQLLIEKGDYTAAYRRLCDLIWKHLTTVSDTHFFNFQAVILYLLRWSMVSTWAAQDGNKGKKIFQEGIKGVIGNYGELFN